MRLYVLLWIALFFSCTAALPIQLQSKSLKRIVLDLAGRGSILSTLKDKMTGKNKSENSKDDKSHKSQVSHSTTTKTTSTKSAASTSASSAACPTSSGLNSRADCQDSNLITLVFQGRTVKFTLGRKLGEGTSGAVYDVICGNDANCRALGSVVAKRHNGYVAGLASRERTALQRIGELRAYGKSGRYDYNVMVKHPGVPLIETAKFAAVEHDEVALKQLIDRAVALALAEGTTHITRYSIVHDDPHDGNVLFQESGGQLRSAKFIDWDYWKDVARGRETAARESLKEQLEERFGELIPED